MKRFLAGVLALTMVLGGAALPAAAEEETYQTFESISQYGAGSAKITEVVKGDFKFSIVKDIDTSYAVLERYTGNDENVTIPSTVCGEKVISIVDAAFEYNKSLVNVNIPETVTYIGYEAFINCSKLESVIIPEGVTKIDEAAFCYCDSIKSVYIPSSIKEFGAWAFDECPKLTDVYYSGSEIDYDKIIFRSDVFDQEQDYFDSCNIHYN